MIEDTVDKDPLDCETEEYIIDGKPGIFHDLQSVVIDDNQIDIEKKTDRQFKNILIVEDDPFIAKEYGYVLTAYGFTVSYAYDAEQAVKIIFEYGGFFFFYCVRYTNVPRKVFFRL